MSHSIKSSCSPSLLKQQWGGIKLSQEVTRSEYMKGYKYFKHCRRLRYYNIQRFQKWWNTNIMDAKENIILLSWKLELQMPENSIKTEGVGDDCLVPEVLPIPVAWCWLWLHTRHTVLSRPSFYLEILRLGLSFFLFPLFFCHTLLVFTIMLSNSWVTWLLGLFM